MNARLARLHEERTQDLALSQQILTELPMPIIGLDPDGAIAFINRMARTIFEENGYSLLELSSVETLPAELVAFYESYCRRPLPGVMTDYAIGGRQFRVQCQAFLGRQGLRGYLLAFHEE
jgi:PAS domain-containing protein